MTSVTKAVTSVTLYPQAVTSVTHGVTDVTPFSYIFGTRNATDHVEAYYHA